MSQEEVVKDSFQLLSNLRFSERLRWKRIVSSVGA